MSDLDKVHGTLKGMLHSIGASNVASQLGRTLRKFEVRERISAVANVDAVVAANTNVTEKVFYRAPVSVKVSDVKYTPDTGNYTASTTNYRTMFVRKRSGTSFGATAATVASLAMDTATTDDLTQWVSKDIPVVAAQAQCDAGTIFSYLCNFANAECPALPAGDLVVTFEEL